MVTPHLSWKFHANRSSRFLVILLTLKQRKKSPENNTPSPYRAKLINFPFVDRRVGSGRGRSTRTIENVDATVVYQDVQQHSQSNKHLMNWTHCDLVCILDIIKQDVTWNGRIGKVHNKERNAPSWITSSLFQPLDLHSIDFIVNRFLWFYFEKMIYLLLLIVYYVMFNCLTYPASFQKDNRKNSRLFKILDIFYLCFKLIYCVLVW